MPNFRYTVLDSSICYPGRYLCDSIFQRIAPLPLLGSATSKNDILVLSIQNRHTGGGGREDSADLSLSRPGSCAPVVGAGTIWANGSFHQFADSALLFQSEPNIAGIGPSGPYAYYPNAAGHYQGRLLFAPS